jgi:xylan 1,4-beta-xylosidase
MGVWEMNRQTGAIKYMRIFSILSDGVSKWFIDTFPEFLNNAQLPAWVNVTTSIDGRWVYTEDENGNPVYNFWHLDCILDTLLSAGIRPIFCVGFMPEALTEGDKVRTTGGDLVNTPNDYNKWRDLVYETVRHCIERYGAEEVRTWFWELWNEPDIDTFFIDAYKNMPGLDPQRYLKMYDFFAAGAKAADSQVKIGGPTAGLSLELLRAFLSHCVNGANSATGGTGAPLDFIVWHGFWDINTLTAYNRSMMDIVKQFPSLKGIPNLEDEWGQPLLVMDSQGHITEDYVYSKEQYDNHEAAFVCKFIDASLTDPENQPGVLARAGFLTSSSGTYRYYSIAALGYFIPMPVLNTYLLLAKMGKEQVELTGASYGDTVHGFAASTSGGVQILLYNFNETDRQSAGAPTELDLTITGLPADLSTMKRYLIDSQNSNPWTGLPFEVSWWLIPETQLAQMEKNSRLKIVEQTDTLEVGEGEIALRLSLPSNSVSLVVIGEEAAPPELKTTPHIERLIAEQAAYLKALETNDKAGYKKLVNDSFTNGGIETANPYSVWGKKALWALYTIAKASDNAAADAYRIRLLATTTLNDEERFSLLNERLRYLESAGKTEEIAAVMEALKPIKEKLEYFANWTRWYTFD